NTIESTTMTVCPRCHQSVDDIRLGVRLTPLKAALFDRIKAAGDIGISTTEIIQEVYRDRSLIKDTTIKSHVNQSMTFWPARNGESVVTADAGFSTATGAKPMLELALQYAGRGWRVIPCRSDKVSRIRNWQVAASPDPETIIDWWTQWPNAWIALLCGCGFV